MKLRSWSSGVLREILRVVSADVELEEMYTGERQDLLSVWKVGEIRMVEIYILNDEILRGTK